MTRTGAWARATGASSTAGYSDFLELSVVGLAETVNRTLWSWNASFTVSSTGAFPPGGSITRVGLWMGASGLPKASIPFPVSQPGAEWMDLMSCPWRGNIATSTNIDYLGFAGFGGPDRETKAMRKQVGATANSLYVVWEPVFAFDVGVDYKFVATASTDAFVLNAP